MEDTAQEKEYQIEIVETLSKTVTVQAHSKTEAIIKAKEEYYDEQHILDSGNYVDTKFKSLPSISKIRSR